MSYNESHKGFCKLFLPWIIFAMPNITAETKGTYRDIGKGKAFVYFKLLLRHIERADILKASVARATPAE